MIAAVLATGLWACAPRDRPPVRIVGSSTIFPFAAKVAETYTRRTSVPIVVEQTGSGGGHKLFCSGDASIDATTSSRPQKPAESAICAANGVAPVIELPLGFDGIVLARSVDAVPIRLDTVTLYHALARKLPTSATDCTPVPNPYSRWSQIDPGLPDEPIEIFGPPPTSGTRDAFVETAMETGARRFPCLAAMERDTPSLFRARVHDLREDGAWINSGENDNAMVRTLVDSPAAIGVLGFSFLNQNTDKVGGIAIGGVVPTSATIRSGTYPVVRTLYLYMKDGSAADVRGYGMEFLSDEASGPGGYLEEIGLIPLPDALRTATRQRLSDADKAESRIEGSEP
ncbi:substrate-binding domain-containing protein [uncultured Algimonas sp.]|uniref:substrate-binding domain-containing protein n=1 Tax=uncultured Algimonas sp. TaxID=1547920 RepID=UPI00260A150E|nr:substrate-binding domain-containing protein [uncultured Algimonas sp.]